MYEIFGLKKIIQKDNFWESVFQKEIKLINFDVVWGNVDASLIQNEQIKMVFCIEIEMLNKLK